MKNNVHLSHAYITCGQAVYDIAKAAVCDNPPADGNMMFCNKCKHCNKSEKHFHPDIIQVNIPDGKRGIIINQIRAIKTDVYIAPNEAARKVYIINNADTMNTAAQNAFLQLLEEPPAHALFILNTSNPSALLATVRSRCVTQNIKNAAGHNFFSDDLSNISKSAAGFASALNNNFELTRLMFDLDKLDRYAFSDFLILAREELGKKLRADNCRTGIVMADSLLTKASEMMELNVSTGHISAMLCASLMNFPAKTVK